MAIRLVTFDALYTLLTPRLPIYVQYSQVFEPFIGVLEPNSIRRSFVTAFKQLQGEYPAYKGSEGAEGWWREVIKRTAVGAGADPQVVDTSLSDMVPRLMTRFSSKEGYKLYDDALPVLQRLNEDMKVRTALVSNADSRLRLVLKDLDILKYLDPIVLSEEVGIEKPSPSIFRYAFRASRMMDHEEGVTMQNGLHVGDDIECDYHGALEAGMHALLLCRPHAEERRHVNQSEGVVNVQNVTSLWKVIEWVETRNGLSK